MGLGGGGAESAAWIAIGAGAVATLLAGLTLTTSHATSIILVVLGAVWIVVAVIGFTAHSRRMHTSPLRLRHQRDGCVHCSRKLGSQYRLMMGVKNFDHVYTVQGAELHIDVYEEALLFKDRHMKWVGEQPERRDIPADAEPHVEIAGISNGQHYLAFWGVLTGPHPDARAFVREPVTPGTYRAVIRVLSLDRESKAFEVPIHCEPGSIRLGRVRVLET
jgi:hypothetical protein